MHAVGEGGIDVGIEGACGGVGVSFDAGNLNESADGVAGHAEVVFQSHFCCIFNRGE